MGKIIKKAALNKNSISYAYNSFYTSAFNSSKLKLVNINQIEPSKENIISGKKSNSYFFTWGSFSQIENTVLLPFVLLINIWFY